MTETKHNSSNSPYDYYEHYEMERGMMPLSCTKTGKLEVM